MRKIILTLALFGAFFFTTNTVSAKGIIIYSTGQKIDAVQELPEDVIINDEHVNLGVMYEQFSIFWIPVWNYGEVQYVLINDKETTYYDLTEEDIEILKTEFNVDVPKKAMIGFWNRTGGKIIWGVVALVVIYGLWSRKNNEKGSEEVETPQQEA